MSFSISVDLSSFFDDFRSKSIVFVDTGSMKKVMHVENHIKSLFGIDSDTNIFSHENFVPGEEDSRVLKTLSNIRLVTLSFPEKNAKATEHKNGIREHADLDSAPSKKRRRGEIDPVDADEISEGRSSKKKKPKKKRADKDDVNGDYSSTKPGTSDDHPLTPEYVSPPQHERSAALLSSYGFDKVKKTPDNRNKDLTNKACLLIKSSSFDKEKKNEVPNRRFYDHAYKDASEKDKHVESLQECTENRNRRSNSETDCTENATGNAHEATKGKHDCDVSTNADVSIQKPKRKRVRKRKSTAKQETSPTFADPFVPEVDKTNTSVNLKFSVNSKHIFFPEEVGGDSQSSAEIPEETKVDTEDAGRSIATEFSDNKTDQSKEDEINNGPSAVSKDPAENTGTLNIATPSPAIGNTSMEPKRYSANTQKSLGKLLSLIRSEDPPVFERSKNEPARKGDEIEKHSKPTSTPTSSRFSSAPSLVVATPKDSISAVASENKKAPIPVLKTIPDENVKISFQILKMTDAYCPELSKTIVGVVKHVDAETQNLLLKIISGAEEWQKPKGKFDIDLEETEEEPLVDEVKLNWSEIIEPRVCQ